MHDYLIFTAWFGAALCRRLDRGEARAESRVRIAASRASLTADWTAPFPGPVISSALPLPTASNDSTPASAAMQPKRIFMGRLHCGLPFKRSPDGFRSGFRPKRSVRDAHGRDTYVH